MAQKDYSKAAIRARAGKVHQPGDLSGYGVKELKLMAKTAGVEGYSTMKKDELIKALAQAGNGA